MFCCFEAGGNLLRAGPAQAVRAVAPIAEIAVNVLNFIGLIYLCLASGAKESKRSTVDKPFSLCVSLRVSACFWRSRAFRAFIAEVAEKRRGMQRRRAKT